MSLIARLLDGPNVRASTPGPLDDYWYTEINAPSQTGLNVTADTALRVSVVYACVRLISETLGVLPLVVNERLSDGAKRRAYDHPLYDVLHDQPNSWQSPMEFKEMLTGHALLRGNGYAEIVSGPRGPVDHLVPWHPDRVKVEPMTTGRLRYSVRQDDGTAKYYEQEQVFHLRGLSSGGLSGQSVISYARESFGLALAMEGYAARFFSQDARPGGVLEHPGKLGDEASKRLAASWQSAHAGVANSHKVAVLEEGLKWQQIGMTSEDAQFLEGRQFQAVEITRWFRVPPHKVGILDRATFCLPSDAEVYTEAGPASIRDVRPGTLVWGYGKTEMELAQVLATSLSGYDRVLTIQTTNRTLRLTGGHRVLARRRALLAPSNKIGGVVTDQGWARANWTTEWVEAKDLTVGDTIITLSRLPQHGTKHAPTRPNVSVGFMEFCGLLLGDGWISDAGVAIARSRQALYMDHYREVMRAEFTQRNGQPVTLQEGERSTRFSSASTSRELRELGLNGNAHSKSIPAWIFRLDEERRLAFLRGFLDADGSVDKKGRIVFHSVSKKMLSQVRHLCMGLGIPVTNLRNQLGSTHLPNGKVATVDIWVFTCSDPGENRRIWSHDPRYQERLIAGHPFHRKGRHYPRYGGKNLNLTGCEPARIVEIVAGDIAEPVYDLQVAGNESFVANGIVVHNSNIEHQALEFVTDTLMPWAVRWEQAVNRDLILARRRFFSQFVFEALLRGDLASRYAAYATARQWGWLSVNDVRRLENLNPVDATGADDYLRPLNMVPLDSDLAAPRVDEVQPEPQPMQKRERPDKAQLALLARDAAARVVRKEIAAISKAAKHAASDPEAFKGWLRNFYEEHTGHVARELHLTPAQAAAYCEQQRDAVAWGGLRALETWEAERVPHLVGLMLGGYADADA